MATFFQLSVGGPALGVAWGVLTVWWLGRIIDEDLVEITIPFGSVYVLFYVAEHVVHVSGEHLRGCEL